MGTFIFLIVLAGLAAGLFCLAGIAWSQKKCGDGFTLFIIGSGVLFMFGLLNHYANPNLGSPKTKIDPGIYKVGFVYQASENVSIGIEKEGKEKEIKSTVSRVEKVEKYRVEHLYLYQFPAKDFDGQIRPDARKLTAYKLTTDQGTFNKYKLE